MSDDDPLADADVGDTVTVDHTEEIWLGQLESEYASGTDRFADRRVSNVEVVTDEYGDKHLAVTVESDVTKRLPHTWDTASEPRTDSERRQARREKWGGGALTTFLTSALIGLGLVIGQRVNRALGGEVTINGEALAYSVWDLVPVVAIVVLVVAALLAIPAMPRGFGGGRR